MVDELRVAWSADDDSIKLLEVMHFGRLNYRCMVITADQQAWSIALDCTHFPHILSLESVRTKLNTFTFEQIPHNGGDLIFFLGLKRQKNAHTFYQGPSPLRKMVF
ncbi:MAG: hypothetical protein ABIJ72_03365 [bacterium]